MTKSVTDIVNEALVKQANVDPVFRQMLANISPRSPSYRYFSNDHKDRFFWTTEKINHKGSAKYVAGIYRFIKTKKQFKLVRKVGFAKKYKAKEWAAKKVAESRALENNMSYYAKN